MHRGVLIMWSTNPKPASALVHFLAPTTMLSAALVKVKVALSVVVNTIFWWSASNHRGQILYSPSDNMDLYCKVFSLQYEGEKTERFRIFFQQTFRGGVNSTGK